MLRWHLQEGRSVIPKSTKPERIAQNSDVFDFELGDDELARIDALNQGARRPRAGADHARNRYSSDPRTVTGRIAVRWRNISRKDEVAGVLDLPPRKTPLRP